MERGPRYYAYAQLRESKLPSIRAKFEESDPYFTLPGSEFPPVKKSVMFEETSIDSNKKRRSSVLAQSVPDFSPALRKENRRPPAAMAKREKVCPSGTKMGGGRRSVNSGEKQSGGGRLMMMGRKSYASIEELKGLSIAASNAINGENRGLKRSNVLRKSTVFATRYY